MSYCCSLTDFQNDSKFLEVTSVTLRPSPLPRYVVMGPNCFAVSAELVRGKTPNAKGVSAASTKLATPAAISQSGKERIFTPGPPWSGRSFAGSLEMPDAACERARGAAARCGRGDL